MNMTRRRFTGLLGAASLVATRATYARADIPDTAVVKHFSTASPARLVRSADAVRDLPNASTLVQPGYYLFHDRGYDCSMSGLYCFWGGSGDAIQSRLVYDGVDLYGFMSGASWHHAHGVEDETLDFAQLDRIGTTHKWRLRCGIIAGLMNWYMARLGVVSRIVNLTTLERTNGIDDGHIVFETYDANVWRLWDITNGVYFRRGGKHLSAAEIIEAGVLNCERVKLDGDEKYGASLVGDFCLGTYADMMLNTPAQIDGWFAGIYQSWKPG